MKKGYFGRNSKKSHFLKNHFTGDAILAGGRRGSDGYVKMEDKLVCGNFWDSNAATVLCHQLGFGPPKDVFATARYGPVNQAYLDVVPVCSGSEASLDSCKLTPHTETCTKPAGVVCARSSSEKNTLDGHPLCSKGFTDVEATALCKEEGFVSGKVDQASQSSPLATGRSLSCTAGNLENCKASVCVDSNVASYTCANTSDIQLVGSSEPGQGTVLFKGGLICDDDWDIEVGIV